MCSLHMTSEGPQSKTFECRAAEGGVWLTLVWEDNHPSQQNLVSLRRMT